jgi:HlyD family secretion protein
MDQSIFRDVALERLSVPDGLDRLLRVTDSKAWMARLAVSCLIAPALVWVYIRRIPLVVSGQA